ncbi:tripartite tricarboxylate transporter substrate binding protein [Roseomonas sp. NAR14]|uniref:Tripartite tricarboxylate transporter substrate binding protein n=1 Tax=Roseomonas acroporae TaxID=2937791 RepID=A0A9X1YDN0_9PROT|nr:tripartite tricarboxylate transporter substrate binding protein [Roseomonas acroporae]
MAGAVALGAGLGPARPGLAQAGAAAGGFPGRPIRLVIPFAPGGAVDSMGRLVAQRLSEQLGQPVVVDNRAGASGTIGGQVVQQAAPDGYNLLFSASTHVMARQVLRHAPYDPVTDFTPMALTGKAPLLMVMAPDRPQTDLAGIIADAKRNPDRWTCAVSALGAAGHLATLLFLKLAGLDLLVAPYRGTAPALTDVAAGNAQLLLDSIATLLPLVQSNGVKGIAVTTSARSPLAPNVPTAAESGMPGLEFTSWYGIWGPKGLPAPLVAQLDAAIAEVMRNPATIERAAAIGIEPAYLDQTAFRRFIAEDVSRNTELLRSANFQPE